MATKKTKKTKKTSEKQGIPVWMFAGGGVLAVGLIVLILFLTGVFGGGKNPGDGSTAASEVTAGAEDPGEPADPDAPLTPEQEARFEEIADDYLYISKDGKYNMDALYDSIMIFSDATALLYLGEYEEYGEFYDVTLQGENIAIHVEDMVWKGTIADGVITLQMGDGSTRVFAAQSTQLYETWMAEVEGTEVLTGEGMEAAGFYRLTSMNDGSRDITAAELAEQGGGNRDDYLVLNNDLTGYMSFLYSVEELTWDESTLWFDYTWEEYTLDGDTLTLTYGVDGGSLTFVRSADSPPAKPEITEAEGVILVKNATDTYFDEVLLVPSTMSFEESGYWASIGPDETVEIDLFNTGASFPCRFDMGVYEMETERTYFVRYLELYDGYDVELKEEGGSLTFVVRDREGNTSTYTAEIAEQSQEEG